MERFNHELKPRTTVVRIFPNREGGLRLVSALCVEQAEEWLSGRKYFDMEHIANTAASTTNSSEEVSLAA